ncbi:unnamed protein product [Protopolystoma xenopodis]|uniref:Uncharacterized protein n=1 Tax=Protopolystoma xenopodis TaxID=117903 RepID=A0A3S5AHX1_9PLAT|nr:unnamed protein product [Protopolystoma xenopodis]
MLQRQSKLCVNAACICLALRQRLAGLFASGYKNDLSLVPFHDKSCLCPCDTSKEIFEKHVDSDQDSIVLEEIFAAMSPKSEEDLQNFVSACQAGTNLLAPSLSRLNDEVERLASHLSSCRPLISISAMSQFSPLHQLSLLHLKSQEISRSTIDEEPTHQSIPVSFERLVGSHITNDALRPFGQEALVAELTNRLACAQHLLAENLPSEAKQGKVSWKEFVI